MGGGPNKQFIELHGQPLLGFALAAFQECAAVHAIVLVRRPDEADAAARLANAFPKVQACADGGAERQDSVEAGLAALPAEAEWVAQTAPGRPVIAGAQGPFMALEHGCEWARISGAADSARVAGMHAPEPGGLTL